MKQSIIERLCGLGTIEVGSAGTAGIEVSFSGISQALDIKNKMLLDRIYKILPDSHIKAGTNDSPLLILDNLSEETLKYMQQGGRVLLLAAKVFPTIHKQVIEERVKSKWASFMTASSFLAKKLIKRAKGTH